jgi:hypothetical protein
MRLQRVATLALCGLVVILTADVAFARCTIDAIGYTCSNNNAIFQWSESTGGCTRIQVRAYLWNEGAARWDLIASNLTSPWEYDLDGPWGDGKDFKFVLECEEGAGCPWDTKYVYDVDCD